MKLVQLFSLALASASTILAAPAPQRDPQKSGPTYYLRVNSPNQPWHHRAIIQIPSTKLLGLENFTVNPSTKPIHVQPIRIPSKEAYALRLPYTGDDLTRTPYIAALQPKSANSTKSAAMKVIYAPTPLEKDVGAVEACPRDAQCVSDAWGVAEVGKEGGEGRGLRFEGWKGKWVAVKDAVPEGWHVYWRGEEEEDGKVGYDVEVEVVPAVEGGY
ncbi:hypothetical protein K469DRAFT_85383 [Zopfia rhizophila CBS 207.26]|uniref:Ubiquitin 3 binding protein But2 C-terminal domain-containing protein n=1 Tax=Zopfia rhizophila CBS 207.26 TaxID=1314779 RepID=A0A6A6EEY1_9PEZI|nr:hypothetical protein K469DRAFT_85383 [Zopfia rhizophila CBS 207.26]